MRPVLGKAVVALTAAFLAVAVPASAQYQSEFPIYRNAQTPVTCAATPKFSWPGAALTSSTTGIYFNHMRGRKIVFAGWVLAWNPNTDDTKTGIRLVHMDDGPRNITEIAKATGTNYKAPRHDKFDVTEDIQKLFDGGAFKHIGHQSYSDSKSACLIYSSILVIVWN